MFNTFVNNSNDVTSRVRGGMKQRSHGGWDETGETRIGTRRDGESVLCSVDK